MQPYKLLLLFCSLLCSLELTAQTNRNSERQTKHIDFNLFSGILLKSTNISNRSEKNNKAKQEKLPVEILLAPEKFNFLSPTPFLSFSCGWNEADDASNNSQLYIRFSENGINWNKWIELTADEHYEKNNYTNVSNIVYTAASQKYYQVKIVSNINKKGNIIEYLFLNFFSPGNKKQNDEVIAQTPELPTPAGTNITCSCALPSFVNRAGWSCPQISWGTSTTNVTHLIVHHSAGVNTSTDWGAVVLSIWNAHVNTNGYSDIGYNWLIDPNGVIYEGRYKSSIENTTGAHFCGTNGATMGVCMLGNFMEQSATANAKNALVRLLSWKVCQRNIDPLATSLHTGSNLTINTISGHRQGCATLCPGDYLFTDLPAIRTAVQSYCENGCTLTPLVAVDGLEFLSITPNPFTGNAFINMKLTSVKTVSYKITGTDGRLYYAGTEKNYSGTQSIELSGTQYLPKGIYIVQVWINKQSVSHQLVKQ